MFLRFATWFLYLAAELLFIDMMGAEAKYWQRLEPNKVAYDPSKETLAWQEEFLMLTVPAGSGNSH
jgi:hypothetical protein